MAGVQDGGNHHLVDLAGQHFYGPPSGFSPLSDTELEAWHYHRTHLILRQQRRLEEAANALQRARRAEALTVSR